MSNSTIINTNFSSAEKGILPVIFVPCVMICYLFYKYGKQKLDISETMYQRLLYLYSVAAAFLLGHVVFKVLPTLSQPYPLCLGVGFFIYLFLSTFMFSNNASEEIYHLLDKNNITMQSTVVEDDLSDEQIQEDRETFDNEVFEMKQRRFITTVLLVSMTVIVPIEGLYLAKFNYPEPVIIAMYWLSKIIETIIVCTSMLHAYFHAPDNGWNIYLWFSIFWCVLISISTLPALVDYKGDVESIIPVMIIYSFAFGFLLFIALYFVNIHLQESEKPVTITKTVIFGICFMVSAIIAIFI